MTDPPSVLPPGGSLSVTDTAQNQGPVSAAASKTRYHLSLDTVRNSSDKLLSGSRSVPILASGASSEGAITVTVPTNTALGNYYLLACADDTTNVDESNETNNCKASANRISIARPDLVETALSNPPPSEAPGGSFAVTDTVQNQAAVAAGSSTTRYYPWKQRRHP